MKRGGKLSIALHVLSHLAESTDRPMTSETIAAHLGTNPVVVRRSLANLRNAGIVTSGKGHGGGWTLARPATSISLGEINTILGERDDLLHRETSGHNGCRIHAVVNEALDQVYDAASALIQQRLDQITLADLVSGREKYPRPG
jgi:Rrf2 family protein